MLDIKKIRREPEQIKAELRKRNLALDSVIDNLCQLDREYRETLKRMERLRVEHKALSKSFYGSGDEGNPAVEAAEPTECGEKEAALGRIKELGATIKDVEKQQQALEWETTNILAALPNLPHKMMTEEEQI